MGIAALVINDTFYGVKTPTFLKHGLLMLTLKKSQFLT